MVTFTWVDAWSLSEPWPKRSKATLLDAFRKDGLVWVTGGWVHHATVDMFLEQSAVEIPGLTVVRADPNGRLSEQTVNEWFARLQAPGPAMFVQGPEPTPDLAGPTTWIRYADAERGEALIDLLKTRTRGAVCALTAHGVPTAGLFVR